MSEFLPSETLAIEVLKPGVLRFGGFLEGDAEGNVRAVVEAQIMSLWLHSAGFGTRPDKILVTTKRTPPENQLPGLFPFPGDHSGPDTPSRGP